MAWAESLPDYCQYRTLTEVDIMDGKATIAVQRTILHMIYYTTITALHHPPLPQSTSLLKLTTSRPVEEMLQSRRSSSHHQNGRKAL